MISVNALINDCFSEVFTIGDGQTCNGTQASNGKDHQSAELMNLVLSDVEVADIFTQRQSVSWIHLESWER